MEDKKSFLDLQNLIKNRGGEIRHLLQWISKWYKRRQHKEKQLDIPSKFVQLLQKVSYYCSSICYLNPFELHIKIQSSCITLRGIPLKVVVVEAQKDE